MLCGLLSLSLEHVQLPRYLRLAPLSLPRLFVYFFTINCLYFYTFNVDIHIFGLYCILYSHCVKAAAGLPNLVRQKNNVISVIQAAPLFLVWLATLHDQPQWQINMVPKSPSITQENITPIKNDLFHRQGIEPSLWCCYILAWLHFWFSLECWTSLDG